MAGGANKKFIDQKLNFLRITSSKRLSSSQTRRPSRPLTSTPTRTSWPSGRIGNRDVAVALQGNVAAGIYDFDL